MAISQKFNKISISDICLKPSNPLIRLNTICPYFTMYPLSFPYNQLKTAGPDDWILDPFCGRGTTGFAARLRGLSSFGIDVSPIAHAISAAKYVNAKPQKIVNLCKKILKNQEDPVEKPTGKFWDLCFNVSTLDQICKVREALLENCTRDDEIALRALMLGILHGPKTQSLPSYLSNQMPRTYSTKPDYSIRYWERNGLNPPQVSLLDLVNRRAHFSFSVLPHPTPGGVSKSDSRKNIPFVPDVGYNWVITSPPYFGMRTYVQDQWLRNWFLGGLDRVDYQVSDQLNHRTKITFIQHLGTVWRNVTSVCAPNAHLVIRFGGLPSFPGEPLQILQESLDTADCGWELQNVTSAGFPQKGKRQSDQFGERMGNYCEEIDYHAILN